MLGKEDTVGDTKYPRNKFEYNIKSIQRICH